MRYGALRARPRYAAFALASALLLAVVMLLSGRIGAGPAPAEAACGQLKADFEVVSRFPKNFAGQYEKKLKVAVTNRGKTIRNWRAELYTFSGFLLGKSRFENRLDGSDRTKIKLKQAMQPGKYTLLVKGTVKGCGELQRAQVASFRDCLTTLPIRFVEKPGGFARDYSGFVSVKIAAKSAWSPIKQVESTLRSVSGVKFGEAELDRGSRRLFGEEFLHHELTRDLEPGSYTVEVTGKAPQPRSCGNKSKTTTLRFQ